MLAGGRQNYAVIDRSMRRHRSPVGGRPLSCEIQKLQIHMKIRRNSKALMGAVQSCLVSASTFATTYNVATIADLNAAIAVAAPGDTIIVQNGVYTTSS